MLAEIITARTLAAELPALIAQQAVDDADRLQRIEIAVDARSPLDWLRRQPHPQKIYWESRDAELKVAGVGVAELVFGADWSGDPVDRLQQRLAQRYPLQRAYGGLRFNLTTSADDAWRRYGAYRFVVPRFELLQQGERTLFACNYHAHERSEAGVRQIAAELCRLSFARTPLDDDVPQPLERFNNPDEQRWHDNIAAVLDLFADGQAQKVVLARKVSVDAASPLEPALVVKKLRAVVGAAFSFCFQLDHNHAFVGATPERLYRRDGSLIVSEALAGTRRRGDSPAEDRELEAALLSSVKERHEQRLVLDRVLADLNRLCDEVWSDGPTRVLKLGQLQHLYNRVGGDLSPNVGDAQIIETLHPTPAMGGEPRSVAQETIERLEPFDRGWYAAPVGWIGYGSADFAVGIRSALIEGRCLSAFSGAGIVAGSTAEAEWQEVENKLLNFRRALIR